MEGRDVEMQEEGEGAPLIPESMRIQDAEAWLRQNSIRDGDPNAHVTLDQRVAKRQFEEYQRYQDRVHSTMFADEEAREKEQQQERARQLEMLKSSGTTLMFRTRDGDLPLHSIYPFAASCETIFALACSKASHQSDAKQVECGLLDYSLEATKGFSQCVRKEQPLAQIVQTCRPEAVPEIACIADYLQNQEIRDEMEDILKQLVDTDNALSMCQLADQIGMHSLFEVSLQHMIRTLGTVEQGSECWEELTPELRERVVVIKTAIESSANHSQRSKLYFNNLGEYISIFAERVQYMKERLAEAKDQLQSLPQGSKIWNDTQLKIYKQEQRVQTLAAALAAQKQLFGSKRLVPNSLKHRQE